MKPDGRMFNFTSAATITQFVELLIRNIKVRNEYRICACISSSRVQAAPRLLGQEITRV
jgi:hypothetical protein